MLEIGSARGAVPAWQIIVICRENGQPAGRINDDSKVNMIAQQVRTKVYAGLKCRNMVIVIEECHFALSKTYRKIETPAHLR